LTIAPIRFTASDVDDELPPVRQLDRDDVAAPDAEPAQRRGDTRDAVAELAERQAHRLRAIGAVRRRARACRAWPRPPWRGRCRRGCLPVAAGAHRLRVGGRIEAAVVGIAGLLLRGGPANLRRLEI